MTATQQPKWFNAPTEKVTSGGANQLQSTARLTKIAEDVMIKVMSTILADQEQWDGLVTASMQSHDHTDDLINMICPLEDIIDEVDFLKDEDRETIDKMIRSQQSKRSRAKTPAANGDVDSYKVMLVGAAAEGLLRLASNQPKSSSGTVATNVTKTPEELEELANDPEKLKNAIRSVQSRISIAKNKQGFDPASPQWIGLKTLEAQLKELRDQGSTIANEQATQAIEMTSEAADLLDTVADVEELAPEEAKSLLNKLRSIFKASEL